MKHVYKVILCITFISTLFGTNALAMSISPFDQVEYKSVKPEMIGINMELPNFTVNSVGNCEAICQEICDTNILANKPCQYTYCDGGTHMCMKYEPELPTQGPVSVPADKTKVIKP